jgi:uncharacterized protein DUF6335
MAHRSKRNAKAQRNRKARSKRGTATTGRRGAKAKSKSTCGVARRSAGQRSPRRRSSGGHAPSTGRRGAEGRPPDEAERSTIEIAHIVLVPSDIEESTAVRAKRTAESMVGDELPGGTVAVPDNDRVDEWASAFGVERSPGSPVRTSGEILDSRDGRRPGRRPLPKL